METVKITGFNLFNQWFSDAPSIRHLTLQNYSNHEKLNILNIEKFYVLFIGWSYNIFCINDLIFFTGLYGNDSMDIRPIKVPNVECCESKNLSFSGNDRYLIALDHKQNKLWKCDFKEVPIFEWKIVTKFWNYEEPGVTHALENYFSSIEVNSGMNLCLSRDGNLYDIPMKINVEHCIGKVCEVHAGYEHAILLTDKGYVYTWGNGRRCQLGHGDLVNYEEPTLVDALAGIKITSISAGGWHSCALTDTGDLYVWGWNDSGQLGLRNGSDNAPVLKKQKTNTDTPSSVAVPTIVEIYESNSCINPLECSVIAVSCGTKHTVVVLNDNSIWSSGSNLYGQCGAGNEKTVSSFRKIYCEYKQSVVSVKCGPWSSLIRTASTPPTEGMASV